MNKIANFVKALNIFFILILLSSCNGEFNFNKRNKNNDSIINSQPSNNKDKSNDQIINSQESNTKDKLEITISCNEESIGEYLKDGWEIKNKTSKEEICSWKSIPANNSCDIEKDKGCKIIKPDRFGTETIYLLEK